MDQHGVSKGLSQKAAQKAILETAITRVVLPIPILVGSPLLLLAAEKAFPIVKSNPRVRIGAQALFVSSTFLLGLPISLSLFDQRGEIDLEVCGLGEGVGYYNKGL